MSAGPQIKNAQELKERLTALKAIKEIREAQLLETARTVLRPATLVKGIIRDIAGDKKTGVDLLKIATSVFSGFLAAKTGAVGKGAAVVSTLFNVIGAIRKKKSGDENQTPNS